MRCHVGIVAGICGGMLLCGTGRSDDAVGVLRVPIASNGVTAVAMPFEPPDVRPGSVEGQNGWIADDPETATAEGTIRHVYDGAQCIADLDADGDVVVSYTWGEVHLGDLVRGAGRVSLMELLILANILG